MNNKLTLLLDEAAIEKGKRYAALHNTSLSRLVQDYFLLLDENSIVETIPLSSKLRSMIGIGAGDCSEEDYYSHLEEKYA